MKTPPFRPNHETLYGVRCTDADRTDYIIVRASGPNAEQTLRSVPGTAVCTNEQCAYEWGEFEIAMAASIRKAKAERDKPGGSTIGPTARRPSPRFFERKRPAGWETWVPLCHDSGSIQRARARIDERGGVAEIVHESWNPETASWRQSPLTIGDMEYLMYYPPAKPWTLWRQGVPLTEWCEEQLLSAINAS